MKSDRAIKQAQPLHSAHLIAKCAVTFADDLRHGAARYHVVNAVAVQAIARDCVCVLVCVQPRVSGEPHLAEPSFNTALRLCERESKNTPKPVQ